MTEPQDVLAEIEALRDGVGSIVHGPNGSYDPAIRMRSAALDLVRAALVRTPETPDHPFKDEWAFQRTMSKPYPGNNAAGQPIPPDQPCFSCDEPFSAHGRTPKPEGEPEPKRINWSNVVVDEGDEAP